MAQLDYETTNPAYYRMGALQPIDVIEDWQLGFCLGNALKYIGRAPHKGSEHTDLRKAIWYIERRLKEIA